MVCMYTLLPPPRQHRGCDSYDSVSAKCGTATVNKRRTPVTLSSGLFWLISIKSQIPPVPLEPGLLIGCYACDTETSGILEFGTELKSRVKVKANDAGSC